MAALPNLWDAKTRAAMQDLYRDRVNAMPSPEEYRQQCLRWLALADKHHTPAQIAAIEADQAKRIGVMK